jgi:thiol-disulfide isomerase/thioredoxin
LATNEISSSKAVKLSKEQIEQLNTARQQRTIIKGLFEQMRFTDNQGKSYTLRQLAKQLGKPFLLVAWGTYCGPCLQELPSIERFKKKIGNKLVVVPIALVQTLGPVSVPNISMPLFASQELSYYLHQLGISKIPASILFTKNGFPLGVHIGMVQWDSPQKIAEVENLIKQAEIFSSYDYNDPKTLEDFELKKN